MQNSRSTSIIQDAAHVYNQQRRLAEGAAQQVNDLQFFQTEGPEANSIAIIMKHVGGNLRSRWTDFLTTDGEKPDRDRDSEFVAESESRQSITQVWNRGWQALDDALAALSPDQLALIVKIRNEPCTVSQALMRSLAHTAHHCGQIVHIAKVLTATDWKTLSIPRNGPRNIQGSFWTAEPR
jgi:hypothetical protein